ncbi:hypothetical protein ARMGADRAFT_1171934 [Armillaria gallica]|uniref:Uncharacterized protein n=1 Tax=Armillaria gallica TaxID=47427 RepID=A0A2H3CGC3_ARMGA|nr:hypothetical protein ARMGADRAFT_1171934 [Armillaria gallica]
MPDRIGPVTGVTLRSLDPGPILSSSLHSRLRPIDEVMFLSRILNNCYQRSQIQEAGTGRPEELVRRHRVLAVRSWYSVVRSDVRLGTVSNFYLETIILSFPIISSTHSRDRLYAVQVVLYGDLDAWDFLNLDTLWISFTVRRDRAQTSLTPCACMAISTDSGASHNPHTLSDGRPSISDSPFF